jgi:hypothetical protein
VAAVPRWEPETVKYVAWEPETVKYVAWEPETVNRKGLQVTKKFRSFTTP